jgi:hypothetical protein
MRVLVLLKHIGGKAIIPMYFKNEDKAINWWANFPCSEDWEIIHRGIRRKSGHRYELMYGTFSEEGKLLPKYVICFSKKEAVILARKIKEANSNYITIIKKLY